VLSVLLLSCSALFFNQILIPVADTSLIAVRVSLSKTSEVRMTEDRNTCVICLDPLPTLPMGACVPCGHCFHEKCFEKWALSSRSDGVKCPTCNIVGYNFVKLYLDLGLDDNDDDDDTSLSSASDDENDTNDDEDELNDSTEQQLETADVSDEESTKNSKDEKTSNDEVIVIDGEPERKKIDDSNDPQKYRKKAKRLKKRVRMLEAHRKKQAQDNKDLQTKHSEVKSELEESREELDEVIGELGAAERELEGVRLQLNGLRRDKEAAISKLKSTSVRATKAEVALHQVKQQHACDLKQAHANSLAEVKDILEQHPKVKEQNRTLKEDMLRKQDYILKLERRLENLTKTVEARVDRDLKEYATTSLNRATKTAKLLRHMDDSIQRAKTQNIRMKSAEEAESLSRMQTKMSSHAARLSRATDKQSSRSGIDALDALDRDTSLQPFLSTKPRSLGQSSQRPLALDGLRSKNSKERSILLPGTKAKRPIIALPAPKAKSTKRAKNDILTMLQR